MVSELCAVFNVSVMPARPQLTAYRVVGFCLGSMQRTLLLYCPLGLTHRFRLDRYLTAGLSRALVHATTPLRLPELPQPRRHQPLFQRRCKGCMTNDAPEVSFFQLD